MTRGSFGAVRLAAVRPTHLFCLILHDEFYDWHNFVLLASAPIFRTRSLAFFLSRSRSRALALAHAFSY